MSKQRQTSRRTAPARAKPPIEVGSAPVAGVGDAAVAVNPTGQVIEGDTASSEGKTGKGRLNNISWKWVGAAIPILYACIRLIVVARGDPETLKGLVLSLDVKALTLGTILPFGSTLLLWVWVLVIAGAINGKDMAAKRTGLILAVLLAPVTIAALLLGMPVRYLLFNSILIVVYIVAWRGGESPNNVVRRLFKALGYLWFAVVVVLIVYAFFAMGMWLPKERLTVNGEVVTGHVLSEADGWTTYMDEGHDLHKVHTDSITNRELVGRGTQRGQLSIVDYFAR